MEDIVKLVLWLVGLLVVTMIVTVGCAPSIFADSSTKCPLGQTIAGNDCQSYTSVSDMQGFADQIFDSLGQFAKDRGVAAPVRGSMYYITPQNGKASPCTTSPNEPYVACYYEGRLYIGSMMLYTNYMSSGALAPITIIAHEYGHYLQGVAKVSDKASSVDLEDQADCVSGAYIAWLGTKQRVKLSSLVALLNMIWEHGSNPYVEPYKTHGTPAERTDAFTTGYDDGLSGCNSIGGGSIALQ
jgi:predicted metalloprotease